MSLYDLTKNISNVTRTKNNKMYRRDCVVAKFIKNNNTINLYYKNYSKKLLKDHMMRDYDEKLALEAMLHSARMDKLGLEAYKVP